MPPGRLPREVFQAACPTGRRPRGRPRTRWRDYVSRLAWERLGVPPEELEEVSLGTMQHVLEWFAAECGSGWDENQHLQIWRPWFLTGKGWLALSGLVERSCLKWRSSSIFGVLLTSEGKMEHEIDSFNGII
ncbi:hypothetical protein L3Q82_002062 [Scortum barcoo]|uniref:Uncharacterized protein n=1 Tax=Scortum barcoo TaxID=214431 RepID=A0ACB8W1H0_9TELE|nr:hypothetical protein L3Q82_002062 [Scortum barcoo]